MSTCSILFLRMSRSVSQFGRFLATDLSGNITLRFGGTNSTPGLGATTAMTEVTVLVALPFGNFLVRASYSVDRVCISVTDVLFCADELANSCGSLLPGWTFASGIRSTEHKCAH